MAEVGQVKGEGVPIRSGRPYRRNWPTAWWELPWAEDFLGCCLNKNPGGLSKWEGVRFALRALGPQPGIFVGRQVMPALEAVDITAVGVGFVLQVTATPGTTLEPEHGLTSWGAATLNRGLVPLSRPNNGLLLRLATQGEHHPISARITGELPYTPVI